MYSTVYSAAIDGMNAELIKAEADISNGLPVFQMVGYLSSEVKEAKERVRAAIKNSGYSLEPKKLVVNLSPASVRKRGASFDLAIAMAILNAYGIVDGKKTEKVLFLGELGLNGEVEPVSGVLPIVIQAKEWGFIRCVVPKENEQEGKRIKGIEVVGVRNLQEAIGEMDGRIKKEKDTNLSDWESTYRTPGSYGRVRVVSGKSEMVKRTEGNKGISGKFVGEEQEKLEVKTGEEGQEETEGKVEEKDFQDIQGQAVLKRAAEIAVAGQHNLLMIGPPGSGKTMVAERIPGLFPPLEEAEQIEVSGIYSVLGMLNKDQPLITRRPFRQVHHTVTKAALIGGGLYPAPGEISLAHKGVLMLDEMAEFQRTVLEVLRQPLETQEIQITRTRGTYRFPADFLLVAASNPCPCGLYPSKECKCTQKEIHQYLGKISPPLLSRIDLCVEAPKVTYQQLNQSKKEERTEEIRERILKVRKIQKIRYSDRNYQVNGRLPGAEVKKICILDPEAEYIMEKAYDRWNMSARTCHKVLKVARTIADMAGEERIKAEHLSEALGYRVMEQGEYRI